MQYYLTRRDKIHSKIYSDLGQTESSSILLELLKHLLHITDFFVHFGVFHQAHAQIGRCPASNNENRNREEPLRTSHQRHNNTNGRYGQYGH